MGNSIVVLTNDDESFEDAEDTLTLIFVDRRRVSPSSPPDRVPIWSAAVDLFVNSGDGEFSAGQIEGNIALHPQKS